MTQSMDAAARVVAHVIGGLAASCALLHIQSAKAADVLHAMPPPGQIPSGQVVYVDDGHCSDGLIARVTGGDGSHRRRRVECVSRVTAPVASASPADPIGSGDPAQRRPEAASHDLTAQERTTQMLPSSRRVHIVYMGGNDCPPCRNWRGLELPKLKAMPEFSAIQFTYVQKSIYSAVPPSIFLPPEVRPLKSLLDEANNGRSGSPQVAILVDGHVYDYFFGTRSAEEYRQMIDSIMNETPYPFPRCLRLRAIGCELRG